MKRLVFLDCETTHIEPGDDAGEIIELGIVGENGETLLDRKILPRHIETASEEALEINGYDADLWTKEGVYFDEIAEEVFELVEDSLIVGQHITFDTEFLRYEFKRIKLDANIDRLSYDVIDIASIIFHCLVPPLEKCSMYLACEHFGISNEGSHRALPDARRAWEVYMKLEEMKPMPRKWPGSIIELKMDTGPAARFQQDCIRAADDGQRKAMFLRKGDRFSYPGSFKIYEAQSDAIPDKRIEGKVVLSVTDHGLRDGMRTRLDAYLVCTIHEGNDG